MNPLVVCWRVIRPTVWRPRIAPVLGVVRRVRPRTLIVCVLVGGPIVVLPTIPERGHLYRPSTPVEATIVEPTPHPLVDAVKMPTPISVPGSLPLMMGALFFLYAVHKTRR
jgi:hypothetical protein